MKISVELVHMRLCTPRRRAGWERQCAVPVWIVGSDNLRIPPEESASHLVAFR